MTLSEKDVKLCNCLSLYHLPNSVTFPFSLSLTLQANLFPVWCHSCWYYNICTDSWSSSRSAMIKSSILYFVLLNIFSCLFILSHSFRALPIGWLKSIVQYPEIICWSCFGRVSLFWNSFQSWLFSFPFFFFGPLHLSMNWDCTPQKHW